MEKSNLYKVIIEALGAEFELNQVLNVICRELLKFFKADRVAIGKFEFSDYSKLSAIAEYTATDMPIELKNVIIPVEVSEYIGKILFKEGQDVIFDNLEDKNVPDFYKKFHRKLGSKSIIDVPIKKGNDTWGFFAIFQNSYYRHWTEEEIEFLHSFVNYIYVAIRQAELYEKQKQTIEREKLLRGIIQVIRSKININEVKQSIVNEIGKIFNADRCYFRMYEKENSFLRYPETEYLSTTARTKLKAFFLPEKADEYFLNVYQADKKLIIPDTDIFIGSEENPEVIKDLLKINNVKSYYGLSVYRDDDFIGVFVIHYTVNKVFLNENDINFLELIAKQAGIALQQAKLYEEQQIAIEREKFIGNILTRSISSFDTNQIKQIVQEIGIKTKADRCYFVEVEREKKPIALTSEYLSSSDIKSIIGYEFPSEDIEKFVDLYLTKRDLVIYDYEQLQKENNPQYVGIIRYSKLFNLKSAIGIPFIYMNKIIAVLAIEYVNEKILPSQDELNFLRMVGNQIGIAYKQIKLYHNILQKAERETLLRKIIDTIRNNLDINTIKTTIVTETGKVLNANRVLLIEFDIKTNKPLILDKYSEYLSSSEEKSYIGYDFSNPDVDFFINAHKELKPVIVEDSERFIVENNLQNTNLEEWLLNSEIKTAIGVSIFHGNNLYAILAVNYTKTIIPLFEEQKLFLRTLGDQFGIALYHAKLLEKEKQALEREILLGKIIESIRSSLDLNSIFINFCIEIGKTLKVNRATILEYPDLNNCNKIIVRSEYKSDESVKGSIDIMSEVNAEALYAYSIDIIFKQNKNIVIDNIPESNTPDYYRKIYKNLGAKSIMVIPIKKGNEKWGILVLSENDYYRHWTEEEIIFMETIAAQFYIAIEQASLYEKVKQTAEKEKTLRELITELKFFKNVEDAFNYLLSKIANIYNLPRTILVEVPVDENEKIRLAYEYRSDETVLSIKNVIFPTFCIEMFKHIIKTYSPVVVTDTKSLHSEDKEVQAFFKLYSISAFIGAPLVRYNHETKLLGILFICSDESKDWSDYEITLLKSINESVVNIIWEILKTIEVNKLRDTFVTTLAHDLQVPIVGDIRALEFLNSRPNNQSIGTLKDIITETIDNDKRILTILKRLLNSYEYESGKKDLKKTNNQWLSIVNKVVNDLAGFANSKSIIVKVDVPDKLPEIYLNMDEIYKVLFIILENAIMYTQYGGNVIISSSIMANHLKTCVIDNGSGIPEHMTNLIFKRYEMAIEIERKIGAGISIYLAKQIVEAHNGKIWYTTESGKGTTFCILLPLNK